jgi:hypothetical protein
MKERREMTTNSRDIIYTAERGEGELGLPPLSVLSEHY